jgi:hypothetical protein
MKEILVAPCGMNCALCSSYLAYAYKLKSKNIPMPYCKGCRSRNKQCAFLKKKCPLIFNGQITYCYECRDFPCDRLRHIDQRYKTLYRMSMIDNLKYIKENGIEKFLEAEKQKWKCSQCGQPVCCHNGICYNCGLNELKTRKQVFRWEDDGENPFDKSRV